MFLLPQSYLEVRYVPKMGRGVFASKDIEAGTVIGDYIGTVISEKDEDKYDNEGHFYLMYYHEKALIYPDTKKPGVHTINHSCTPNVWMYTYKGHTLYFAIRRIFKGEELTVSYLMEDQDKTCDPCNHLCFCGSIICSGSMHMSKDKHERWSKLFEIEEKQTKRKRVNFGKVLPYLDSYPNKIPDNPFCALFGYGKVQPYTVNVSKLPKVKDIRKLVRQTGRVLKFPKLNLVVLGVSDGVIFSRSI